MMDEGDDLIRRSRERVGTLLKDKWRLERLLGMGGMAAVYEATHRNGKRAAVKMLHVERSIDRNIRSRFLREGYVANKVNHPGAVSILDDDVTEDGAVFLVMELLEGESLQARLSTSPQGLPPALVLSIADQVLAVLESAHEQGIVHRDLKPDNLFLTTSGVVKVLDFGIARLRELTTKSNATGSSASLGTPAFMPPEQARGRWEQVDAKSDLWAVGATMFTLASGRHVHEATTVNEHLLAAMTVPAPKLSTVVATLPEALCTVVDRALAFDRNDRWPSASEMRRAVQEAYQTLEGQPIPTVVAAAAEPGPRAPASQVEMAHDATTLVKSSSTTAASAQVTTVDRPASSKRARFYAMAAALAAVAVGAALFVAARNGDNPSSTTPVAEATSPSPSGAAIGAGAAPVVPATAVAIEPAATATAAVPPAPSASASAAASTTSRADVEPAASARALKGPVPPSKGSSIGAPSVAAVTAAPGGAPAAPAATATQTPAAKPATTDPLGPVKTW